MKILVTGGTGFIGSYIIEELLEHDYHVKILTRRSIDRWGNNIEVVKGDITIPDTIREAFKDVEAVFHNAAYAMDYGRKKDMYNVNVAGTENIAKLCIENDIDRIIYTSSAGVYGFPDTKEPITEDSPKKPLNYYQKSKLLGEKALNKYREEIKTSAIRPPLVFGAGGVGTKIILDKLVDGSMIIIGDGNNIISVVHPRDVAKCLRLALEKDNIGTAFNVVSFTATINDFIGTLSEKLGVKKPDKHVSFWIAYIIGFLSEYLSKNPSITRFRVKTLATNREVSSRKAEEILGYKPSFNLDKTAEDMVRWYKTLKSEKL